MQELLENKKNTIIVTGFYILLMESYLMMILCYIFLLALIIEKTP